MSQGVQLVSVDGSLVPSDRPVIRADDRGFLHGDGAFETIRVASGAPRGWSWHLERLRGALETLAIDAPVGRLRGWLDALLVATGTEACAARISVSRGWGEPPTPTVVISLRAMRAPTVVHLVSVPAGRALPALKSLAWLPAAEARRAHPGAEPLFVDGEDVLEGATSNVFVCDGETLVTPAADGRILPGVMRRAVLAAAGGAGLKTEARRLTLSEVRRSQCFVTNAVIGLVEVDRLDAAPLRPPGRWLQRVREGALALLAVDDGGAAHRGV